MSIQHETQAGYVIEVSSLHQRLQKLTDGRKARGVRYALNAVLVMITSAPKYTCPFSRFRMSLRPGAEPCARHLLSTLISALLPCLSGPSESCCATAAGVIGDGVGNSSNCFCSALVLAGAAEGGPQAPAHTLHASKERAQHATRLGGGGRGVAVVRAFARPLVRVHLVVGIIEPFRGGDVLLVSGARLGVVLARRLGPPEDPQSPPNGPRRERAESEASSDGAVGSPAACAGSGSRS